MFASSQTRSSSNLCHQLLQREMNMWPQCNPSAFAGHLFSERYRLARNLYKTDLRAHYGCVNAIEFSHGGRYLASGGDDKRVLIWDVEKAIAGHSRPRVLHTEHTSNIFCLSFDRCNRRVFSGGNDDLVIVHDFETGKLVNVFKHDNPVYGLSIDPQCDSIFATACEDGQILVFDQRIDSADPLVVAQLRTSFHAVEFHPAGGNFLVTANSKRGAAFWDIRKPHHPVIQYGGHVEDPPSCMSVRFNSNGSLILALRRRLPPILYNTQSPEPVCTFYHGNYYNSCTMKSCTFAGENDEFVLSGSDDFNLYVWRVSDVDLERTDQWVETTQMVLYGHRSIVNQVRYNRQKCLLASSGVEKIVKLWSPFAQKEWAGSLLEEAICSDNPRELYSPYNFASMSTPPHSWSHMSHDYSSRNTSEDPRMMAFFDSLIQQEIEGWETNSSTDSPLGSDGSQSCSSSNDSSDSSLDDDDDDDDDGDDDDDDDGDDGDIAADSNVHVNNGTAERTTRHLKRHLVRRKEFKHRKSVMRKKVKLQRHKYVNRIAYLIATKRSRLRRLAIKGASLSDRRPFKIVRVGRNAKHGNKPIRTRISKRHAPHRLSVTRRNNLAVETSSTTIASTSTASVSSTLNTAAGVSGLRFQRRKYKKHCACDTSSDDGRGSSNAVLQIPSNAPSTSTGITTTLKDDIIRLRQQQQHIIDSDEYDDDEPISPSSHQAVQRSIVEVVVDPTIQPTKKLNGVRRANDAAVMERSSRGEPSVNTPPSGASMSNYHHLSANSAILGDALETHRLEDSSSSAVTAVTVSATTMLPQMGADNEHNSNNVNSNGHNSSNNNTTGSSSSFRSSRRRPYADFMDNYSSHSNSRLSNSSCQDDLLGSSSSDLDADSVNDNGNNERQYSTPLKRRKLAINTVESGAANGISVAVEVSNNYNHKIVNARRGETDNTTLADCISENSNHVAAESTSNPIAVGKQSRDALNANSNNSNVNTSQRREMVEQQQEEPEQQQYFSNDNSNHRLNPTLMQTPDSGISIATTNSLGCISTDSSGRWHQRSNGGLEHENTPANNGDATNRLLSLCDENANAPMSIFQQKVARVRRNYRQKFADESDDSD